MLQSAIVVLTMLGGVTGYCFWVGYHVDGIPEDEPCKIWLFGISGQVMAPNTSKRLSYPRCMDCVCRTYGVYGCCSYGIFEYGSADMEPPRGCAEIPNPGSCYRKYVDEQNPSLPCPGMSTSGRDLMALLRRSETLAKD